jgi:hypothetical protein
VFSLKTFTETEEPIAGGLFGAVEVLQELDAVQAISKFGVFVLDKFILATIVVPALWDGYVHVAVDVSIGEGLCEVNLGRCQP